MHNTQAQSFKRKHLCHQMIICGAFEPSQTTSWLKMKFKNINRARKYARWKRHHPNNSGKTSNRRISWKEKRTGRPVTLPSRLEPRHSQPTTFRLILQAIKEVTPALVIFYKALKSYFYAEERSLNAWWQIARAQGRHFWKVNIYLFSLKMTKTHNDPLSARLRSYGVSKKGILGVRF